MYQRIAKVAIKVLPRTSRKWRWSKTSRMNSQKSSLRDCRMWMLAGRPFFRNPRNSLSTSSSFGSSLMPSNNWKSRAPALDRSSDFTLSLFGADVFLRRNGDRRSSGPLPLEALTWCEIESPFDLCFGELFGVEFLDDCCDFFGDSGDVSSSIELDLTGLGFHPQFFQRWRLPEPSFSDFLPGLGLITSIFELDVFGVLDDACASSSIKASFRIISSCVVCNTKSISKSSLALFSIKWELWSEWKKQRNQVYRIRNHR